MVHDNIVEFATVLEHKPGKLVTFRGHKQFSSITSGDKAQITVLACGNAAGHILPPMIFLTENDSIQSTQ